MDQKRAKKSFKKIMKDNVHINPTDRILLSIIKHCEIQVTATGLEPTTT